MIKDVNCIIQVVGVQFDLELSISFILMIWHYIALPLNSFFKVCKERCNIIGCKLCRKFFKKAWTLKKEELFYSKFFFLT